MRHSIKSNLMSVLNKRIKEIKRPLMLFSIVVIGIMIFSLDLLEKNTKIERFSPVNSTVCGAVCDIEIKNDKEYIYLKNISFTGDNSEYLENVKESHLLSKHSGCICVINLNEEYRDTIIKSSENTEQKNDDKVVHSNKKKEDKRKEIRSTKTDEIYIGSRVTISGKIGVYENGTNPGEFNARRYYISNGYLFKAYSCEMNSTDGKRNVFSDTIYKANRKIAFLLDESLNEKDAGMLKAIMLADKTGLQSDIKDLYVDAGAGHLLAISGLHITLIASVILWAFMKLPIGNKYAYIATIIVLFLYGFMIGFSASALRAIVMFTILCIGKMRNKSYDTLTAMAFSALITALFKPLYVLQTGFLMSYLAIIGIASVLPAFKEKYKKKRKILSSLLMSISITLSTLPVVVNSYYKIPLFAPLLNLLIIPGMSIILPMGFLCAFAQFSIEEIAKCFILLNGIINHINSVIHILGSDTYFISNIGHFIENHGRDINIFSHGIHIALLIYEYLMKFDLSIPFSVIRTGARSKPRCIIYEIILFCISSFMIGIRVRSWQQKKIMRNLQKNHPITDFTSMIVREKNKKRMRLGISYMALAINLFAFLIYFRTNRLDFLDVGQGLCACVQYNGRVYCFDAGSSDKSNVYSYIISPYLDYYAINKVDAWFISHADADHVNGIEEMLEEDDGLKVKQIIIPKVLENDFADIEKAAIKRNINVTKTEAGKTSISNDKNKSPRFICLSPSAEDTPEPNACSLVILMQVEEGNVLLMGDAESAAEERIISYIDSFNAQNQKQLLLADTKGKQNILSSLSEETNSEPLRIDVLQVAHHGSSLDTNSEGFLRKIHPGLSVISCGFENKYSHPHEQTLIYLSETGTKIKRTDYDGCVSIFLR